MEVIQLLILGWVVYSIFKGGNPWVIVAALAVGVWFPQISKLVGQAVETAVDLLKSVPGAL